MRLVSVSDPGDWGASLDNMLSALPEHRDDKGSWRRFPFYYTLLALTELDHPRASEELKYVRPVCEKRRARLKSQDDMSRRKIAVLDRVLESTL
jgi:hypothetical protein|tara:strand:+ start:6031 stop:6312 length:282 start_codon:yes stop_codon:yes gene_type:complete